MDSYRADALKDFCRGDKSRFIHHVKEAVILKREALKILPLSAKDAHGVNHHERTQTHSQMFVELGLSPGQKQKLLQILAREACGLVG